MRERRSQSLLINTALQRGVPDALGNPQLFQQFTLKMEAVETARIGLRALYTGLKAAVLMTRVNGE